MYCIARIPKPCTLNQDARKIIRAQEFDPKALGCVPNLLLALCALSYMYHFAREPLLNPIPNDFTLTS